MDNNSQICIQQEEEDIPHAHEDRIVREDSILLDIPMGKKEEQVMSLSEQTMPEEVPIKNDKKWVPAAKPLFSKLKPQGSSILGISETKPTSIFSLPAAPIKEVETEIKAKVIGQMAKPPIIPLLQLPISKEVSEDPRADETTHIKLPTDETPSQLGSTPSVPSSRQWQKVSINKRRSTTQTTKEPLGNKPSLPVSIGNVKAQPQQFEHPKTFRENLITSPEVQPRAKHAVLTDQKEPGKLRRKTEPGEIMPLFDCIFCCQEHFVLAKLSENFMSQKYSRHVQHHERQKAKLLINLELKKASALPITPIADNKKVQVPQLGASLQSLRSLINQEQTYISPIASSYLRILQKPQEIKAPIVIEEPQKANNEFFELEKLSDSSFFEEGALVNIKTRRQRIIETISFESECHNIYDPYFTSEDELLSESSANNSLPSYLRLTPRRFRATRQPIPLENSLDSEFSVSSMNTSAISSEDELMIIHGLTPIPGDPSGFQSGRRRIEDFIVREDGPQRVIQDEHDQSLSSIEKDADTLDEGEGEFDHSISDKEESKEKLTTKPLFAASSILNIQENRFTPEREPFEPQRCTFGQISPKGTTVRDPFLLASGSPPTNMLRIPNQKEPAFIQITDQSAISSFSKKERMIQDLSPVLPRDSSGHQRKQHFGILQRCGIQNQLEFSEQDEITQQINFYPPPPNESLNAQPRLSNQRLKMEEESYDMSFKLLPVTSTGMPKDTCFSPIHLDGDDNSLSREGVSMARDAFQNIPGPCFSSDEYDDITLVQQEEPVVQESNQMLGGREVILTSKFPNHQFINESTQHGRHSSSNLMPIQEPHTINLGYNQSQSFSAFDTKHLIAEPLNHTPIATQNLDSILQQDEATKKMPPKKFLIKQDQLSKWLQKALENKISQTASNIQEQTTNSQPEVLSLYDSIVKQDYSHPNTSSQLQIDTSNKRAGIPKHKKQQKTLDLDNQESSVSLKPPQLVNISDFQHQEAKRAPKAPGTTAQIVRKVKEQGIFKKSSIVNQSQQSRQVTHQTKIKNYHQSFNKLIIANELGTKVDNEERPLTLREHNQREPSFKIGLTQLRASPKLVIKASLKQKGPEQMTQQELNEYLRSAICSSRYSSSSISIPQLAIMKKNESLVREGPRQAAVDSLRNSRQRRHSSAKKQQRFSEDESNERLLTKESPQQRRMKKHFKQSEAPLLTECYEPHQHQLSIDHSLMNKMSGKAIERRQSQKAFAKPLPGTDVQKIRLTKPAVPHQNIGGSVERQKERKDSLKQLKTKKSIATKQPEGASKERLRNKKLKLQTKQQQQLELQAYLNLCNSINFSNDITMPFPKQVGTSLVALPQSKNLISHSYANDKSQGQKNLFNSGSSLRPVNMSNSHASNTQQHPPTNQTLLLQDTSSNNQLLLSHNITHLQPMNQTASGNEMSTTISNNQLSLTRINATQLRVASNGKVNQTSSSGNNHTSQSGLMNQTVVTKKVVVPQLQLSKLKNSGHKQKLLNGSHDEIQLQNLLMNLNQHLQAQQTRGSLIKDSINATPHATVQPSSFIKQGNTKRSRASSLSNQRASEKGSCHPPTFKRKDSIGEALTNLSSQALMKPQVMGQHLNQTVQTLRKKQETLPQTQSALVKLRRKKSKELPTQQMVKKGGLQNSFTLKHLRLMMGELKEEHTFQQQFTMRQTDRAAERSGVRQEGTIAQQRTFIENPPPPNKERLSSQQAKLLLKNQAVASSYVLADNEAANRSSLLAKQQPKPKQGVKLTAALPAELLFNRFYDTGKQTLLTQVTSPYRKPVEKPQASVPNISAPPRQQQFSMKNVFTKQQSSKKLEV